MKNLIFFICLVLSSVSYTQLLTPQQIMFPTSQGDSLEVDVYLPNASGSFPVILIQTPYGKNRYRLGLPLGIIRNLSISKYAFVIMDWRGRFSNASKALPGVGTGEDGYDLVEWIATQTWSTGKIGTWGPSALGSVQFETAKKQPPHLTCAVPLVAAPHLMYEHYYAGGAARTELIEQIDNLGFGVSSTVSANPYYNTTWSVIENLSVYPDSIEAPMLMIGGWYDHNTESTIFQYDTCTKNSSLPTGTKHHLLLGPWTHGGNGTSYVGSANQGQLNYPNAEGISDTMTMKFFDYHLRNQNNGWNSKPPVMYYQMGDEQWLEDFQWPVSYTTTTSFFLQPNGSLSTSQATRDSLVFSYNPNSPSPTIGGATMRSDLVQGPYDQGPDVESRFDLLSFETPVSSQDLKIKGRPEVYFYISSDRKDTDVAVRLTEVYPDGRSMLIMDGIKRMRFRNGYRISDTAFMQQGTIYPVTIDLKSVAITIKAGNKLRLIVTGSNYPKYNRNMNNGEVMYPGNNLDSVFNPLFATNKIHLGTATPSRLVLPIDNTSTSIWEEDPIQVSVYPNPTTDWLKIASSEPINRLELYDLTGKLIVSEYINTNQLNMNGIKEGVYILVIETSKGRISKKVMKE